MRIAFTLIIVALWLLSSCKEKSGALSRPEAEAARAAGNSVNYSVDTAESRLYWKGSKPLQYSHEGTVPISKGSLQANALQLTAGAFEIDLSHLRVTDISDPAENADMVNHLKDADFFDVATYPSAGFVITKVEAAPTDSSTHTVYGNLRIKDVTREIPIPATLTITAEELRATAKFKVNRADFNVRYRSGRFFPNLGDKLISDDIEFRLDLKAAR